LHLVRHIAGPVVTCVKVLPNRVRYPESRRQGCAGCGREMRLDVPRRGLAVAALPGETTWWPAGSAVYEVVSPAGPAFLVGALPANRPACVNGCARTVRETASAVQ
jgi:hypothetical protein